MSDFSMLAQHEFLFYFTSNKLVHGQLLTYMCWFCTHIFIF